MSNDPMRSLWNGVNSIWSALDRGVTHRAAKLNLATLTQIHLCQLECLIAYYLNVIVIVKPVPKSNSPEKSQ